MVFEYVQYFNCSNCMLLSESLCKTLEALGQILQYVEFEYAQRCEIQQIVKVVKLINFVDVNINSVALPISK